MMVDQRNFFLLNRVLLFGLCSLLTACNVNDAVPVTTNSGKNAENQNNENQNKQNSCQDGDQKAGCACDDGDTGFQVCADGEFDDQCICEGQQDLNLCGGTSKLTYEGEEVIDLDQSCGPCNDGTLVCNGQENLTCDGASDASACLPTGSVKLTTFNSGEEPWNGDWQASVFLLKDFSRACIDALDELNRPEHLRPISNITVDNRSLEFTIDGIPTGTDYRVAVVLHTTVDDKIVTTSIGCTDVHLEEEGQVLELKGENELRVYDLPAQMAETLHFQLRQSKSSNGAGFSDLLGPIEQSMQFATSDFGNAFLGCLASSSGSCHTDGILGHIYINWSRISPHAPAYPGNLADQVNTLINRAQNIHFNDELFGQYLSETLNNRWQSVVGIGYSKSEFHLGWHIVESLSSIKIDTSIKRRYHSTPETEYSPFHLAYKQDVNFTIDEIALTWPLSSECYNGYQGVDFSQSGCVSQTYNSQDTTWLMPSGEVTIQSHGWRNIRIEDIQLSLRYGTIAGLIVDAQLNRMASAIGFPSGKAFFSSVFNCSEINNALRDRYNLEKSLGNLSFTTSQLNALLNAFGALCSDISQHGDALFRAAVTSALFEENSSAAQSALPFELFDGSPDDRYLNNYPFSAAPGAQDWEAPGLNSTEDFNNNNCEYMLIHYPLNSFHMCVPPSIQLPD